MKSRIALTILCTALFSGCNTTNQQSQRLPPDIEQAIAQLVLNEMSQSILVVLAAELHREAFGDWPSSLEQLASRTEGDIDFSEFDQVEFTPISENELKIDFKKGDSTISMNANYDSNRNKNIKNKGIEDPNFKIRIYNKAP